MKYYTCQSVRLCRYLYSLGFEKKSIFDSKNKECWIFEYTNNLQKALDFYFVMRKKLK